MPTSTFDDLMTEVAIPAIQDVFGIAAVHTNSDGDEADVTIVLDLDLEPVGEYLILGERMEARYTVEVPKSYAVAVGDTFTVENEATSDDPYPDDTIWEAVQLLRDDGLLQRFAVRDVSP